MDNRQNNSEELLSTVKKTNQQVDELMTTDTAKEKNNENFAEKLMNEESLNEEKLDEQREGGDKEKQKEWAQNKTNEAMN